MLATELLFACIYCLVDASRRRVAAVVGGGEPPERSRERGEAVCRMVLAGGLSSFAELAV